LKHISSDNIAEQEPAADKLMSILQAANVGVWELDLKSGVLTFDDTMYKLFGLSRKQELDLKSAYGRLIHPDDRALVMAGTYDRINSGESRFSIEFRVVHPDGTMRHILGNMFVERNEEGIPIKIVGADSDITELRNTQDQLRETRDMAAHAVEAREHAESANRFKSRFLANISHEIRTPLAVIRGYSEILAQAEANPQRKSWIERILHSSEQLELLINDIMDISKVEAGKLELQLESVSLSPILADVKELLNIKASEKGIGLIFSMEGHVPPFIRTDPLRLKQILINIIGNAIKFTDHGQVSVTTTMMPANEKTAHELLAFVVSDTGIGMTPEERGKIFKAFTQADSSISRKFGGSGLGLSISLGLAHLLGGDIVVDNSEPGKGSTFTITIDPEPSSAVSGTQASSQHPLPSNIPAVPQTGAGLDGLEILLVDDAEDVRILIDYILSLRGAHVTQASDGQKGLEEIKRSWFDVVLMDIQMPVLDGFQAIHQLRSEGCLVPVFALTAHAMKGERERCITAGFTDYLSKPINVDNLIQLIKAYTPSDSQQTSP
jgi:PAS domain S-box-containing protein